MPELADPGSRRWLRFGLPALGVVAILGVAASNGPRSLSPLLEADEWRDVENVELTEPDTTDDDDATENTDSDDQEQIPGDEDDVVPNPVEPRTASAVGMVRVDAGSYVVGVPDPDSESAVQRRVELQAYYIDEFEITNAQYERFVQVVGAPAPVGWPTSGVEDGLLSYAVVGIDWAWAEAYCTALGKRLPTESEWEASARGPDGSLYPWGDDRSAVDLDNAAPGAIGAIDLNVSDFGVHDTVGGVWEWVDEPYVKTLRPGQVVRHGGEYGQVRNGAAMRQTLDPANQSAIAETGFRCAATEADDSVTPGEFDTTHALPPEPTDPDVPESSAFLVDEQFEDLESGWPVLMEDGYSMGYHAPSTYRVDATAPATQVMALGGYLFDDAAAETSAYVDSTQTSGGEFRFGLVFRASGELEAPEASSGPDRPFEFYAFVVNPRDSSWTLLHEDHLPFRVISEGPLPDDGIDGFDKEAPITIRAEMVDITIRLSINGAELVVFDTRGWHPAGDVGFYVETLDATSAQIHFRNLLITKLELR